MTCIIKTYLRRFCRDESGVAETIHFALFFPFVVMMLVVCVEMGITGMKQVAVNRAVDETVRELRLGNPNLQDHADIKSDICNRAATLEYCEALLRVNMTPVDLRTGAFPAISEPCVDVEHALLTGEDISPGNINKGENHETVLIIACYQLEPITAIGELWTKHVRENAGFMPLITASAFVNEPVM